MGCSKCSSKRKAYSNTTYLKKQEKHRIDNLTLYLKCKKKKSKINKIRNGEVTTDTAEIQRIIRDYYEQLYGIKWITWKKWTDS